MPLIDPYANINKHLRLRPSEMRTFSIQSPAATHWRAANCAEVDCERYLAGWDTIIAESDPDLGQAQAHYIRKVSGRPFTEERDETGLTVFHFAPGTVCFDSAGHKLPLGRPELFIVREGDHRGNPRRTPPRVHARPELFVEDFAEHQQHIADIIERG